MRILYSPTLFSDHLCLPSAATDILEDDTINEQKLKNRKQMLTKLLNCNVIASTFVSLASVSLSRRKRKNKNESVLIESLFLNESKAREAEKELREGKKKNTVTNCSGNLNTKNNGLFQCQQCRLWTHAECAGNGECSKGKFIQSNEFSDEDRISLNIRSGTFITCNCGKHNNGYRIADTENQKVWADMMN
ncbi:hypothetical protein PV328_004035 [Microctonus aethiopoides]|uniref:Uncharacterized protein n=1 Tax=Microctonus aethiopoides TaxID=144406 RepID=A0AA39F9N7_9HYME|nr:hypothetical protein PV328_004035 [Microctonus aethiopoides]